MRRCELCGDDVPPKARFCRRCWAVIEPCRRCNDTTAIVDKPGTIIARSVQCPECVGEKREEHRS
jgi:predicted amidophosphoribosyltransferase